MSILRFNCWRLLLCLPIVVAGLAVVAACRPDSSAAPPASGDDANIGGRGVGAKGGDDDVKAPIIVQRASGGGVRGSVYVQVGTRKGPQAKPSDEQIYLPDIKVYLHNKTTGKDSEAVLTDLFGRYAFGTQLPGTYLLRWEAQRGWAKGEHPNPIVIKSGTQYPIPARIVADEGHGVLFGRVTFSDAAAPWYYDELFVDKHTATVTVLDAARQKNLADPVRANVVGWYAVAGLPRGVDVAVRAQAEASMVTRAVSSTAVSFGGAVLGADVKLPNHKPEILTVVPAQNGAVVQTALGGTTIELKSLTRDQDGDKLTYDWRVLPGMGALAPTTGPAVKWTLPKTAGKHSVYLQVKDGRGGYARHRVDFETGLKEMTFSGRAVDRKTGNPVAGANVSVNGTATTTAANGFFQVKSPLTKRYVCNINKSGYALFSRVVDGGETGQTWKLAPTLSQVVDPTKPIVLVDKRPELDRKERKGVTLRIPADSLVDTAGNKPTKPLTAHFITYDITDGEAPGDWGALKNGKETNLISLGAGFVEFVDTAGTKFNLGAGRTAEVEVTPLSTMMAGAPAATPMWSYDEADGYWKQSGDATLDPATKTYRGKVKHFSAFNTDLALDQAACLKVLLYPPLPTGVKLRMTDPTGTHFAQTFDFVLDRPLRGIYRVPANIDVKLELFDPNGNAYGNLVLEETPGVALPGNIVNSGPPIPPGQTLWPDEPYDTCKLIILRLAIEATPSVFLTFKGEGTAALAAGYYATVDPHDAGAGFPQGRRTTLGAWWTANGFTLGADGWPLDSTNGDSAVVRTSYLNNNDLGSGRDMYFRDLGNGHLAAFVTNYGLFNQDAGNADLALARATPGASVCMEYSPVEGQGATPIVKFFVFAGGDFKANAPRQAGAELDGFGVKFVPNLCLNCHGGNYFPANAASPTFAEVNMSARFRELDTATYKFPGGGVVPSATEKTRFKEQNVLLKNAGAGCTAQGIRDLITGWYPGASTDQDNTFTPPGWVGMPRGNLYHDVVKRSCRTCHIAFDDDASPSGINWTTYDQLKLRHDTVKGFVLCDNRFMPHAVVTYRNFWLSGSPHQPGALRNYSDGAAWPMFGECAP
jgi:protocatechuate 3,4-dioxygenase beta subunit